MINRNYDILYKSTYICMKSEVKKRMNEYFARNPHIKKSHWVGQAIEEKLEREKEGVYGHDKH